METIATFRSSDFVLATPRPVQALTIGDGVSSATPSTRFKQAVIGEPETRQERLEDEAATLQPQALARKATSH